MSVKFNVPENMGFVEAFNTASDIAQHVQGQNVMFEYNGVGYTVNVMHKNAVVPKINVFSSVEEFKNRIAKDKDFKREIYFACCDSFINEAVEDGAPKELANFAKEFCGKI